NEGNVAPCGHSELAHAEREAVHVRHDDIHDDSTGVDRVEEREPRPCALHRHDGVSLSTEDHRQGVPRIRVVVDDKDGAPHAPHPRFGASSLSSRLHPDANVPGRVLTVEEVIPTAAARAFWVSRIHRVQAWMMRLQSSGVVDDNPDVAAMISTTEPHLPPARYAPPSPP